MRAHLEVNGIWRARFERLFDRDDDEKLAVASNWQQLYKWQRASISYTDGRAFDEHLDHMIYMDTGMYGIKKVIPTRDVLFVLDNSGAVRDGHGRVGPWHTVECGRHCDGCVERHQNQRHSLFVLSQIGFTPIRATSVDRFPSLGAGQGRCLSARHFVRFREETATLASDWGTAKWRQSRRISH